VNSTPKVQEEDDKMVSVFPHEARMRNLTYSTDIYADIKVSKLEMENYYEINQSNGQRKKKVKQVMSTTEKVKVPLGKIPVMLRSKFC
jgi:DNA-directed RNA polymerase II subunit RPB2